MRATLLLTVLLLNFISAHSDNYQPTLAVMAVLHSQIAYSTPQKLSSWSCALCRSTQLTDIQFIRNRSLQAEGYVGYSPEFATIIISFRGTKEPKNYFQDLRIFQKHHTSCTDCKVHRGFLHLWNSLRQGILQAVKRLLLVYPSARIMATGHSLGGALAAFCAESITKENITEETIDLYTFGQPRVGNKKWKVYMDSLNINNYRLVHYKDFVPHTPLKSPQYTHNGYEVWYSKGMKEYQICEAEDSLCSNQFSILTRANHKDNHSMRFYSRITADAPQVQKISLEDTVVNFFEFKGDKEDGKGKAEVFQHNSLQVKLIK